MQLTNAATPWKTSEIRY
uniref:Uncharacterized protein n=1 Tax=Anguilla anguilla TaxID=7936 RepID=A0A0E9SER3_ANGAN